MTPLALSAAAIILLAALPVLAEALRRPTRARGNLAALTQGRTHYRWSGPKGGPVAVCVHGLSTPSFIFAATERSLNALGYRVLTYDLYGRGQSDRVRGRQDPAFFLTQLRDLLRDQQVMGEFTLLGFSMGGQIACAYGARNPHRLSQLILVAPAGMAPLMGEPGPLWWRAPVLGDWMMRVAGGWKLRRELVEHRTTPTIIPDLEDRQAAETRKRGFLPALLSSRRHMLTRSALPDLEQIARQDIPLLALWGAEDPVVPLAAMGALSAVAPDAHHGQIAGAGHNLLQTHPAQVAEHLAGFLKG